MRFADGEQAHEMIYKVKKKQIPERSDTTLIDDMETKCGKAAFKRSIKAQVGGCKSRRKTSTLRTVTN